MKFLIPFVFGLAILGCGPGFETEKGSAPPVYETGNSSNSVPVEDIIELVPIETTPASGNNLYINSLTLSFRSVTKSKLDTGYYRYYTDRTAFQIYNGQKVTSGLGPMLATEVGLGLDTSPSKQMCLTALFAVENPVETAVLAGPGGGTDAFYCSEYTFDDQLPDGRVIKSGTTYCSLCKNLMMVKMGSPFSTGNGPAYDLYYFSPTPGQYRVTISDNKAFAKSMTFEVVSPIIQFDLQEGNLQRQPNSIGDLENSSSSILGWIGMAIAGLLAICTLYFIGYSIKSLE